MPEHAGRYMARNSGFPRPERHAKLHIRGPKRSPRRPKKSALSPADSALHSLVIVLQQDCGEAHGGAALRIPALSVDVDIEAYGLERARHGSSRRAFAGELTKFTFGYSY
jgi:hypothetical protein